MVELAGLPGSGKTTIAALARAELVARGVPCTVADRAMSAAASLPARSVRRLALAAAECARRPRQSIGVVRGVRATGPGSWVDGAAGTVQWLAVQAVVVRSRRRAGVHLLEEGPLQTLWTLGLRVASDRAATALARQVRPQRPGLTVVVDAPVPVVAARLAARSSRHSRTQLLEEPARTAELLRGRELLDGLLDAYAGDHLMLLNDGSQPPSVLASDVADWVLRAVGGSGGDDRQPGARLRCGWGGEASARRAHRPGATGAGSRRPG